MMKMNLKKVADAIAIVEAITGSKAYQEYIEPRLPLGRLTPEQVAELDAMRKDAQRRLERAKQGK